MAKRIFISATNTNVGKTYTTIELINYYIKQGFVVGAIKPIETGVVDQPIDGSLLLNAINKQSKLQHLTVNDIVPYQFELPAAPFVANKDMKIDISLIEKKIQELEKVCDIILIEGAGGLMVPIEKNFFMYQLIQKLNAKLLLVTSSKLGSINDTLLSLRLLESFKDIVWCINLFEDKDSFSTITKPFYDAYFKDYFILQKDIEKIAINL